MWDKKILYEKEIEPYLTTGKTLMFSHGFNIRYRAHCAAERMWMFR